MRRTPNGYTDAIKYMLHLWLDAGDVSQAGAGRAGGTRIAAKGAMDFGDVEMMAAGADRSENTAKPDRLEGLALDLNLISPDVPLLSPEDRHDLALLDKLNQAQTRIEQVIGLESEIATTAKWNFDAVSELLNLATRKSEIPFGARDELFDLEPTAASAPGGSKGKGRLGEGPKKRSLYNMLPVDSKGVWTGLLGKSYYFIPSS